jgi:hypothetical protein
MEQEHIYVNEFGEEMLDLSHYIAREKGLAMRVSMNAVPENQYTGVDLSKPIPGPDDARLEKMRERVAERERIKAEEIANDPRPRDKLGRPKHFGDSQRKRYTKEELQEAYVALARNDFNVPMAFEDLGDRGIHVSIRKLYKMMSALHERVIQEAMLPASIATGMAIFKIPIGGEGNDPRNVKVLPDGTENPNYIPKGFDAKILSVQEKNMEFWAEQARGKARQRIENKDVKEFDYADVMCPELKEEEVKETSLNDSGVWGNEDEVAFEDAEY